MPSITSLGVEDGSSAHPALCVKSKQHKFETAIRAIAANMMPLTTLTCLRRQHTPICGFQGLMPQADILLLVTECFGRREKSPPGRVGDRLYIARLSKVPKGTKLEKRYERCGAR